MLDFSSTESKEPDNDDQFVGGAVVVRLQVALGAARVRRGAHAARTLRPHLETRHRPLQQVRPIHVYQLHINITIKLLLSDKF